MLRKRSIQMCDWVLNTILGYKMFYWKLTGVRRFFKLIHWAILNKKEERKTIYFLWVICSEITSAIGDISINRTPVLGWTKNFTTTFPPLYLFLPSLPLPNFDSANWNSSTTYFLSYHIRLIEPHVTSIGYTKPHAKPNQ